MRYYVKQGRPRHHENRTLALQGLLERHEAELATRRQLLRGDIIQEPGEGRDAVESSADNFARDVGAALLEATARTVQGIEDALRRIKNGAYGTCQDCGERIPALRLQALPFAERCRNCQQQYDPAPRTTPLLA